MDPKTKTPLFPLYSKTAIFLKLIDGVPVEYLKKMNETIKGLRGTPQNSVDWSDPDEWIGKRLSGDAKNIAEKIWNSSKKYLNPRWTDGIQFLMNNHQLVTESNGKYQLTERGKKFISSDDNAVIREMDEIEGLVQLLYQASVIQSGKRSDLIVEWKQYLDVHSYVKQESVVKDYLRRRLVNLADRGYLERKGNSYEITDNGIEYLKKTGMPKTDNNVSGISKLSREIEKFNKEQRARVRKMLEHTTPTQFEHLIEDLLAAMDYYNIEVTSQTNDKGVDVTAEIQHGITTVKEVIQVKRFTKGNVGRVVLDQLRGSLHRFDAFQGTIITLSDFAKGAKDAAYEKGAAPITLIDGEKLIDYLIEYELLVEKKQFDYYVIKENYFGTDNETEIE